MFHFLTFFALVVAAVLSAPSREIGDVDVEVLVVDDISGLELPEGDIIPLLASIQPSGVTKYVLGNRQAGDRVVAAGSDGRQWSTPQDIKLTLNYPTQGIGAIVTYVEILVDQSSNLGRGYIVSGGIGQRSISIVVEAQTTSHFSYQAAIYGV